MSVYSVKGKGWRYDFTLKGVRHTEAWFKTKAEAKRAEAQKREELTNPSKEVVTDQEQDPSTGMAFLELLNRRLDHVNTYNSERHYKEYRYLAKRWAKRWSTLRCDQISESMVEEFMLQRSKVSAYTANKDLRYLRATFNFGLKKRLIQSNPTERLDFIPVEKRAKYIPSIEDIDRVIAQADSDTQDYLWVIRDTMARVSEVNRLTWDDVDLKARTVVLYTRKKRGGHLTPRTVPMTDRLLKRLLKRFQDRRIDLPWVFWHRYWSRKEQKWVEGPYQDRKMLMASLCKKAGVRYFRYHALRHAGATALDNSNVPLGAIQRLLGHENRTTTEIYLHSIGCTERDAMKKLEQATSGVREKSHTDSHTERKKRLRLVT
jgi:integrase